MSDTKTMVKVLFILLFFTSVVLLPRQVFAADACVIKCTNGANIQPDGKCPATGTGNPIVYSCKDPNTRPDFSSGSCICNTSGTATAPVPAAATNPTPCTGPSCSNGGGQLCWITPGSPDNGKPVPAGTVPAAGTKTGILTAIGCIPTEPQALIAGLLRYGTLASGGIAFLLMILAAFQMITAEGNPNTIKTSQEKFYSAIIGLLLIIFSVLLLQVIGVDLLGLRGFGA